MASLISQTHVDQPLSNLSVAYKNANFVADRIFPQISVNKKSNTYFIKRKQDAFQLVSPLTDHNSAVRELKFQYTSGSYDCLDYALMDFVSDDIILNADAPLQPLVDTTENLTDALLLARERALATKLFSTSQFTGSQLTDLSAGTKWTNAASEPLTQILNGVDSMIGIDGPFCILFGNDAWRSFRTHPDVLATFQLSIGGAFATEQMVKEHFGFEDVIIAGASYNTANEGQTASYARVWSDSVLIFKRNNNASIGTTALGNCLRFGNLEVRRQRDEMTGVRGGENVKVGWTYEDKILASDAGHLIYDVN